MPKKALAKSKPRRVMLTLEVETTAPIRELRRKGALRVELDGHGSPPEIRVIQTQANLIQTLEDFYDRWPAR